MIQITLCRLTNWFSSIHFPIIITFKLVYRGGKRRRGRLFFCFQTEDKMTWQPLPQNNQFTPVWLNRDQWRLCSLKVRSEWEAASQSFASLPQLNSMTPWFGLPLRKKYYNRSYVRMINVRIDKQAPACFILWLNGSQPKKDSSSQKNGSIINLRSSEIRKHDPCLSGVKAAKC